LIDRKKNLCYIVTVDYFIKNGVGEIKQKQNLFISIHSVDTKKCQEFAKQKAKSDKQFHGLVEEWISQYTVPLLDYCK